VTPTLWSTRPSCSLPAEFSGEWQPEEAEVGHLGDDIVGEAVLCIMLRGHRRHDTIGEVAHQVAYSLLVIGEVKVHGVSVDGSVLQFSKALLTQLG
jgi:hypothetical protein